jgi:hypothetical protein
MTAEKYAFFSIDCSFISISCLRPNWDAAVFFTQKLKHRGLVTALLIFPNHYWSCLFITRNDGETRTHPHRWAAQRQLGVVGNTIRHDGRSRAERLFLSQRDFNPLRELAESGDAMRSLFVSWKAHNMRYGNERDLGLAAAAVSQLSSCKPYKLGCLHISSANAAEFFSPTSALPERSNDPSFFPEIDKTRPILSETDRGSARQKHVRCRGRRP